MKNDGRQRGRRDGESVKRKRILMREQVRCRRREKRWDGAVALEDGE